MDVLFSTNNLMPDERFEYWHESVCNTYAQVNASTEHIKDYSGYIKSQMFGELTLTESCGKKVQFERTKSHVCTDPREEVQLFLLLDGHTTIKQNGNVLNIRPGDIAIYDSTQPYQLELERFKSFTTIIPKSLVSHRDVAGKILKRESLATSLISKTLSEISNVQMLSSPLLQRTVTQNLIDLICVTLSEEEGPLVCSANVQIEQIKQYLLTQLCNPDVSIEMVANAMSMSPRTLHRIFSMEAETVMNYLWKMRLMEIHKQLIAGKFTRVGNAALEYGFSDFSHFSRSFKKHFGYTPTSLLTNQ